jgi:hypothetical protein
MPAKELGKLGFAGGKSVKPDGWSYPPPIRTTDSLREGR